MSDSLREQLLQAGFTAPKEKSRDARKNTRKKTGRGNKPSSRGKQQPREQAATRTAEQEQARKVQQRKATKAKIKSLIESVGIQDIRGESVYRFTLNKRIRELHVKDDIRTRLVEGDLVITRLNGSTWVIPADSAPAIRELNPDWVVILPATDNQDESDEYRDFPVPDDLQW